jgi:hypothetical protein
MEQWRLATLSFQMWGALTPSATTKEFPAVSSDNKKNDDAQSEEQQKKAHEQEQQQQPLDLPSPSAKRSIGQAEIESAFFKVSDFNLK